MSKHVEDKPDLTALPLATGLQLKEAAPSGSQDLAIQLGKVQRPVRLEESLEEFPELHLVRSHWLLRRIAAWTMALLVLTILAMLFVPWQQTTRGAGRVIALDPQERTFQQRATAKGVVAKVREGLREGTFVKKGEFVLELEPLAAEAQQQLEAQRNQLLAKLEVANTKKQLAEQAVDLQRMAGDALVQSARESVEAAVAKVTQSEEKVKALDATVERTKQYFDRTARLLESGLKAPRDFEKEKEEFEKAVADFENGEAQVIEAFRNRAAKEQDLLAKTQEAQVKNREVSSKLQEVLSEMATTRKEISEIELKLGEFGERLKITSPRDGYLQELIGLSGADVVKEGEPLFTVVPVPTQLAVELTITGNDVPLLQIGDEVRLQFEGFPAIQFVGWPSSGVGTFGGKIALILPTDDGTGNFRMMVTPYQADKEDQPWPEGRLRQGSRAVGWVLLRNLEGKLSRVPLGYEIWRQLNGFPPVLSNKPPDDVKGSSSKEGELPKTPKLPKSP